MHTASARKPNPGEPAELRPLNSAVEVAASAAAAAAAPSEAANGHTAAAVVVAPLSTLVCSLPPSTPAGRVVMVRLELPRHSGSPTRLPDSAADASAPSSSSGEEPLHLHVLRLDVVGSPVDGAEGPWQADHEKYSERMVLARALETHPTVARYRVSPVHESVLAGGRALELWCALTLT